MTNYFQHLLRYFDHVLSHSSRNDAVRIESVKSPTGQNSYELSPERCNLRGRGEKVRKNPAP